MSGAAFWIYDSQQGLIQKAAHVSIFYLEPANVDFQPGTTPVGVKLVNQDFVGPLEGGVYTLACLPLVLLFGITLVYIVVSAIGFASQGVTRDATVTACLLDPPVTRKNSSIELTYIYAIQDRSFEDSEIIVNNYIDCDDAPVGSTIQIQYMPHEPTQTQVVDARLQPPIFDRYGVYCAILIALAGFGFYTFIGIRGMVSYRKARRKARRLRDAVLLDGSLTETTGITHGKSGSLFHVHVTYAFQSPLGVEMVGKQHYLRDDLNGKPLPAPGTPVKVLYTDDTCYLML
jgi:hypothetical protein